MPSDGPSARARTATTPGIGGLHGSDYAWAIAFALPYVAVFFAFVLYPICYGLYLGSQPELYSQLFADPRYFTAVLNTVLYVGIGVNLKMFLAFLLSGFFMRKRWWIKALLVVFILPWATPALPAYISIHWLLNGQWGMLNNVLYLLFGIDGPVYLNSSLDWVWRATSAPISGRTCRSGRSSCWPAGWRSRRSFMRRPRWMARPASAGSRM